MNGIGPFDWDQAEPELLTAFTDTIADNPPDNAAHGHDRMGDGSPDRPLGARLRVGEHPMTLKEAAALLGVTPDNLRGAIARGALRAVKHGRDWWVSASEVERYRKEHRRAG